MTTCPTAATPGGLPGVDLDSLRVREVSVRERLPRDVVWILALACLGWSVVDVVVFGFGYDSHAYWQALQGASLYDKAPTEQDAFLYSPAFAQAISLLAKLPFALFCAIVTIASGLAFWWLLRPLPARLAVPCWLMTTPEIVAGNIFWLLALVAVWGTTRAAWWLVAALTKVTPFVGPVWFLVRGEWRRLGVCLASTIAVAATSYAIDPDAWHDWVAFLVHNQGASQGPIGDVLPLLVRLPIAVVLVAWAATSNRAWVVPVAMVVATPVLATASFTMLAAIPRIVEREQTRSPSPVAQRTE